MHIPYLVGQAFLPAGAALADGMSAPPLLDAPASDLSLVGLINANAARVLLVWQAALGLEGVTYDQII